MFIARAFTASLPYHILIELLNQQGGGANARSLKTTPKNRPTCRRFKTGGLVPNTSKRFGDDNLP